MVHAPQKRVERVVALTSQLVRDAIGIEGCLVERKRARPCLDLLVESFEERLAVVELFVDLVDLEGENALTRFVLSGVRAVRIACRGERRMIALAEVKA